MNDSHHFKISPEQTRTEPQNTTVQILSRAPNRERKQGENRQDAQGQCSGPHYRRCRVAQGVVGAPRNPKSKTKSEEDQEAPKMKTYYIFSS